MTIHRSPEPMALATGFPRILISRMGPLSRQARSGQWSQATNGNSGSTFNSDRRAAPGASVHGSGNLRDGFTLIEAMIAITMTLIIMLALAQGFKRLSDDISQGRARLALSDQLRSVSEVLRNDLASLTVDPDPTTPNNKLGYFMYYDGPVTDYTAATLPINTLATGTTEQRLSASKYGDFDDILMFTAKANGDFFKGRVPLAIVKGAAAAQSGTAYSPIASDWDNSVVMASEFAEIVYFMIPVVDETAPFRAGTDVPNIVDTETSVGLGNILLQPDGIGRGNAVPDRFVLCRRVLLIIDSLNITYPSGYGFPTGTQGLYFENGLSNANDANTRMLALPTLYRVAMQEAYKRCDLSVARVRTPSFSVGGEARLPIAANSLDSLSNPLNRFAHTMRPITGTDYSMPILSLTGPIAIQQFVASRSGITLPATTESGFMRPEFMRLRDIGLRDHDSDPITPDVLVGEVDGSEFLAMNCVGFDLKGFDTGVRLLYNAGSDDLPQRSNGSVVFGTAGTDDLVLNPSDPGYDQSIGYVSTLPAILGNLTASTGAFVDIGWGLKSTFANGGINNVQVLSIFNTPLSGTTLSASAPTFLVPSSTLFKSGRTLFTSNSFVVYQPCFDSFTDMFENDGFNQFNALTGTTFIDGLDYLQGNGTSATLPAGADLAVNGLDDPLPDLPLPNPPNPPNTPTQANGLIDDLDERDTSPPINFAMPAIQVTIRLEDKQAGVIQQIAVTQSLVNP